MLVPLSPRRRAVPVVVGILALLSPTALAQTSEEILFESVDKVELHGTFFPSAKGRAPCVMLLHKFGGSRQQDGWKDLARALQPEFAVLAFDFRGHGDSASVNPDVFWRYPNNVLIRGAARLPQKIAYKDFAAGYLPVLANDIAAAKRYLDRQNDAGVCNSSNVIVIGAEEGAALGALWINAEFERFRLVRNAFGQWVADPTGRLEGEDIAGAVWLTIPKTLAGVYVGGFLEGRGRRVRDRVPMAFFYGTRDAKGAAAAQVLYEDLRRSGREKIEQTRARAKDTKLAGSDLLTIKAPNTVDEVVVYCEKVMQKRGVRAPVQRDVDTSAPAQPVPLRWLGFSYLR